MSWQPWLTVNERDAAICIEAIENKDEFHDRLLPRQSLLPYDRLEELAVARNLDAKITNLVARIRTLGLLIARLAVRLRASELAPRE